MPIIRSGYPIVVELIDLVKRYNFFQITLLRLLTFLPKSLTVILTVLLFWNYFYFLITVFVLQWLYLH